MIDFNDEDAALEANASPGFEGYLYQVDVSVWAGLDLVLAKGLADHVILEPPSWEDLEAELDEDQLGPVSSLTPLAGRKLVIQAKLRNTGPWDVAALERLLKHGEDREPAATRLERDRDVAFLLVTSADISGTARSLRAPPGLNPTGWSDKVPATLRKLIPNAVGRFAIVAGEDRWKLNQRLRRLLEDAFRVPHAKSKACLAGLRVAAIERMRGVGAGRWTREEMASVVQAHDGRLARLAELDTFVRPTNWGDLLKALRENNAIILTGTSGTGKTTTAKVLADVLSRETPGLSIVPIDKGPQQVRNDTTAEPVLYLIDDPWGHYRFEPDARPWNDELGRLLETASGNRRFIVTSRTDVLRESGARALPQKWYARLEAENYGRPQRVRLFETRLSRLSPHLQLLAEQWRNDVLTDLLSPLEIQKFFDLLGDGNRGNTPDHVFLHDSVRAARETSIEDTVVEQVKAREATSAAAVLWGLLKARPKQSREQVLRIEAGLARRERELEDALDPFIDLFVAARHLRQDEKWISYYHPRIEKALEAATALKPARTRRLLGRLADVLVELDGDGADDWGRESAAALLAAVEDTPGLDADVAADTQARLDQWLAARLSSEGEDFRRALELASKVGRRPYADVARWLLRRDRSKHHFLINQWKPLPDDEAWYAARRAEPFTAEICERFVRYVLPRDHDGYPEAFTAKVYKLAPDLDAAFLDAADAIVHHGVNFNLEAIAAGALRYLDGFAAVATSALDVLDKAEDDPDLWLAIRNGEYSDDYAEHLAESHAEDGYSASELVEAYVAAVRKQRGWQALLSFHPPERLAGYWLRELRKSEAPLDPGELRAVAGLAEAGGREDDLWWVARRNWSGDLTGQLLGRVEQGHADADVRRAAAYCAMENLPDQLHALARGLADTNPNRLAELVVDLTWDRAPGDGEATPDDAAISALIEAMSNPISQALHALKPEREGGVYVGAEALAWLQARDPGGNLALRLRLATALAREAADVADHIQKLLASAPVVTDVETAAAMWAIGRAAADGDEATLRANLQHRIADVRRAALLALAARTSGALAPELLALAADKGSRVRFALLDLLDERRDPSHIPTLVAMAGDIWNESSGYYGEAASSPVSRRASAILATTPNLTDEVLDRVAELVPGMEDDGARDGLLKVLAHGGAHGQRKLVAMAIDRTQVYRGAAAAWALVLSDTPVAQDLLSPIDVRELLERRAVVAVAMSILLGLRAAPDHVRAAAEAVSGHPKRRALMIPLLVGSAGRADGVPEMVATHMASALAEAVAIACGEGPKLRRDAVPDGDARIGDQVLKSLSNFFEPAPK